MAPACARDVAIRAPITRSAAASSAAARSPASSSRGFGELELHQHVPGRILGSSGSATPGICRTMSSTARRGMSSNVVSRSPRRAAQPASSSSACSGEEMPTSAVALSFGRGKELEAGGRDDAERAFGTDEQGFQVVAGVVLAQAAQAGEHPAVRQHHLQTEHQIAHHAVAQHRGAAGVGRQIAADLRRALRTEAQGEQTVGACRRGLRGCERATRLDDHEITRRRRWCALRSQPSQRQARSAFPTRRASPPPQ